MQNTNSQPFITNPTIEHKIDSVMNLMTLDEKIGQMNQITGQGELTGPVNQSSDYVQMIRSGMIGSMLNVNGTSYTRQIQKIAMEQTRLKIPIIFGYDVIHGYKTIFPVPLGEAASWNPALAEQTAHVAAVEASAAGQHWTFAPMVDIARDPRWGRIMEGSGEDPYLGSRLAEARVHGFQGKNLGDGSSVLACAKHFVGYGASEAGRDYNTVDFSERRLWETYLPPFKAALDAGCATFMCAFNEYQGVPCSGNQHLIRDILKTQWNYQGMVVSDWGSVREQIPHGVAANCSEASTLAVKAGVDMDMEGYCYSSSIKDLINKGLLSEAQINEAVRRILRMKFVMGLFDDPYRYCNEKAEKTLILSPEHRNIARQAAEKSMVLLKNEGQLLPLSPKSKIALIGPLADNQVDIIGTWNAQGVAADAISVKQGFINYLGKNAQLSYAKGCEIEGSDKSKFAEAIKIASQADVVVMVMGESALMTGEALCRSEIDLPGVQRELIAEILKTGKPVVLVLMNGRPLTLVWENENVPAILEAWFPGTEGGNALANVLFGKYNPSGKLPVCFPYSVGQIPVYYNYKNTGRPRNDSRYSSKYLDIPNEPLYSFGYGMSYTSFTYDNPSLSKTQMKTNDTIYIKVKVSNTGKYAGEETVQLYLRDMVSSATRPVKELVGFQKVWLEAGKSTEVSFAISAQTLSFYNAQMQWVAEPGDFKLFVGGNPKELKEVSFSLIP
jgi:beta-glucosidase